jgi:hypothetical protein
MVLQCNHQVSFSCSSVSDAVVSPHKASTSSCGNSNVYDYDLSVEQTYHSRSVDIL